MKQGSYLYLGIVAFVLSLAVVQFFLPNMLPAALYSYVAMASFVLTLLELLKSAVNHSRLVQKTMIMTGQRELDFRDREIAVLGKFPALKKEVACAEARKSKVAIHMEKKKAAKWPEIIAKLLKWITIAQIILLFVFAALYVALPLPSSLSSEKTTSILALLSFALMVFSYYLSHSTEESLIEGRNATDSAVCTGSYYLNCIEKLANKEGNDDGIDRKTL